MNIPIMQRPAIAYGPHELEEHIGSLDWQRIGQEMDAGGYAVIPQLVHPIECRAIASLYSEDSIFRSRIIMQRHAFGQGEYKYFRYPLPGLVERLRVSLYSHLVPIANRWYEQMRSPTRFPIQHDEFLDRCHGAGQERPTPLLAQYVTNDYNCIHQDLYGDHVFPLQAAVMLAQSERDFTGGEFILVEQRPRMQSKAEVVSLAQGDTIVFAVHNRPVIGSKGAYKVNMRHGVSRIRSGLRHTLGIIFHDAA